MPGYLHSGMPYCILIQENDLLAFGNPQCHFYHVLIATKLTFTLGQGMFYSEELGCSAPQTERVRELQIAS